MSNSPSQPDLVEEPADRNWILGGIFLACALAQWHLPWICLWLMPEDGVRWLYLAGGNFCGAAMLAAIWITSGSSKWWLRILQGVALLAALVGSTYLLHRPLLPAKIAPLVPIFFHAMTLNVLIVCTVGLVIGPYLRGESYRLGPVAEPDANMSAYRVTLAELFQAVTCIAVPIAIYIGTREPAPAEQREEIGSVAEFLIFLIYPSCYVLLQGAHMAGHPQLRLGFAWFYVHGIVLSLIVALPFVASTKGASLLFLCMPACGYLLVYLVLSALYEWDLFRAIPAPPYQRTRYLSAAKKTPETAKDGSPDARIPSGTQSAE